MAKKDLLTKLRNDPALEPQKLLDRFRKLLETRRLWEPVIQELADYINPETNDIIIRKAPGVRRTEKLFDSTAIFASELLAANIHGTLTSAYTRWFSLVLPDEELNEDEDIATWLDSCASRMFLAFNQSNFSQEAHEMYNRLVPFGTGCLLFEEKEDRNGEFLFRSIRFQDMAIAEGPDGRVDSVFRSFPYSRRNIMERWPEAEKIEEFADSKSDDPDHPYEVINSIVPSKADKRFKYASVYTISGFKENISVKGFYEMPALVVRWSKETGETYGRGRGHTALPDIKTLNKMVEMELRALGKVVNPPVKAKGGDVIGQVKLNAGGVSTVRDMESLKPLFEGGFDYQPVNLKIEDLKQSVRKMFYSDQLEMPQNNPQMTATEVNTRYELMQRVLGPTLGRLESEFLDPLVSRAFKILLRAGKFLPIPAKLQEAAAQGGKSATVLNVRYEGPLARAQKSADVTAVQQLEAVLQPVVETHPEVMDNLDLDGLVRHTASVVGIPARYIKDQQTVDAARAEKQKEQQAQQEQQATLTAATAAGKAAPMVSALKQAPEQGSEMAGGQQNGQVQQGATP